MTNRMTLTDDEAQRIGGAMHRLKELAQTKILSPAHDAERQGQIKYLQNAMVEHADEFLACWLAVKQEYEPLCFAFASLLSRATGIIQKSQAARKPAAAPAEEQAETMARETSEPSNVIHLERAPK